MNKKDDNQKVHVVAAHELDEQIISKLKQRFGNDLEIRIDESLLGGIRIRKGNDLYDSSVKTKLQNLRKEIIAG